MERLSEWILCSPGDTNPGPSGGQRMEERLEVEVEETHEKAHGVTVQIIRSSVKANSFNRR
jgi:hypothetical protein